MRETKRGISNVQERNPRMDPPLPIQRIPNRGSGIHHNYDEIIRQSAYSSRFPKHPLPACVAGVPDWTAREVNRAMGFGGGGKGPCL
ncbi:hypothetical protein CEXT_77101 [Caerostris extrusa]|uniref:Uncharacterized protein n=1 Tax=Caerostris extrusa TaxID=172846 RepID=A0AAV4MVE8_CAEEX|nr:hypothetical protein CEXT_77101 [Caerostris extrusa]